MHLTDHISDVQLNEYLDQEASDGLQIELHLSACAHCAARLNALQAVFDQIESLPELAVSPEFASRFTQSRSQPARLPRSLTLTVTLQAVLALVAILIAAPFVMQFVSPYVSSIPAPSFADLFLQIQSQWMVWLDMLSTFRLPGIPEIPVIDFSSLFMSFTVIGVSLLWLIGNGLLLRNQMK
jgi:hypothetical protein